MNLHKYKISATSKSAARTLQFLCLAALLGINQAAIADPTRISVTDFVKDPQKVAALQKGIASMRTNNNANPMSPAFHTSFAYWANTHGYFGNGKYATNLKAYIAYRMPQCLQALDKKTCDQYYAHMQESQVPNDGFTNDVWGTCQHGNLNFLPWHRLYLHFYEKTLRKQTGDQNFALPYWDYYAEKSPDGKGLALPALVRSVSAATLYDQFRTPGLNDNTSAIDPDNASAAQAFKYNDFTNFSNNLQGQPHGVMHCAVGTGCSTPDMGFVPIAGLDPVFYMHHANIDRLWQCWLNKQAQGKPITLAWAKANLGMPDSWYDTPYSFADENGAQVKVTIADAFNPAFISTYAQETNCDISAASTSSNLKASLERSTLKAHKPVGTGKAISLRGAEVVVPLQIQSQEKLMNAAPVPDAIASNGGSLLILENVQLEGSPALTYKVYIGSKKTPAKSAYIATFNYFGVGDHGGDHAGHSNHSAGNSLGTLIYNVTDDLQNLGINSAEDITIKFVPTNLTTSTPKAKDSSSGVTVGNIRLETLPIAP